MNFIVFSLSLPVLLTSYVIEAKKILFFQYFLPDNYIYLQNSLIAFFMINNNHILINALWKTAEISLGILYLNYI